MKGKTTHEIEHVEQQILERLDILQNGETKQEKRKARSEIIFLEKHLKNVNDKNEKVYPERMKGFPDDKPMDKEAVLKLIDSVDIHIGSFNDDSLDSNDYIDENQVNLEGVSVGKNTFEYVDLGWPKAKEPKQGKLL